MVVKQIRQMSEDNQQLLYFKNKAVKEKKHSKAMEESFDIVTEKLRKTMEEDRIVRGRAKMQHEEIKEEVILTSDTLIEAYLVYFVFTLFTLGI
jgi:glutaredoxin 2